MEVLYLYSLKKSEPPTVEIDRLEDIKKLLHVLTKRIEPQMRLLEERIQKSNCEILKEAEISKLKSLLKNWQENCRRVGAYPIGTLQCRIYTEEGPYHWQYSYLPNHASNY